MELARLLLDLDRIEDARAAFEEAERLLVASSPYWLGVGHKVLDARLAIRCDDHERAYKLLRKMIKRGDGGAEAQLLFAIAARATDHVEDYEAALAAARNKGADVTAFGID